MIMAHKTSKKGGTKAAAKKSSSKDASKPAAAALKKDKVTKTTQGVVATFVGNKGEVIPVVPKVGESVTEAIVRVGMSHGKHAREAEVSK
jgi:hypothetical protein